MQCNMRTGVAHGVRLGLPWGARGIGTRCWARSPSGHARRRERL